MTYNERDHISTLLRAHHPMDGRCWCGFQWQGIIGVKCRVCRSLINSGEPHVFRKGWWYCWRHATVKSVTPDASA